MNKFWIKQTGGYAGGPFESTDDARNHVRKTIMDGGEFKSNCRIVDDSGKDIESLTEEIKNANAAWERRCFQRMQDKRKGNQGKVKKF